MSAPLSQAAYLAAVSAAQHVIGMHSAGLAVDGKWGRYTQSKYDSLSSANRAVVNQILFTLGTSAESLAAYRSDEKVRGEVGVVSSSSSVEAAIAAAALKRGVPLSDLKGFVRIESGGNPKAVNGSSRGLTQMQPAAWADAQKLESSLESYKSVLDPYQNALAGATYYQINKRRIGLMPGFSGPVEPAMVYLAHQQGAAGFAELWNASQGRKTTNLVTARAMTGNPPQDGRGVTTNKAEFYTRWLAVARKKMA